MIIYICGPDSFRSLQYLKQTIEQFKIKRDPQGLNVVNLATKSLNLSMILTEVTTSPFLADRRMIIINNVLSNSDSELLSGLLDFIRSDGIPQNNIVVFYQSENVGKGKEAKELANLLGKQKYAQKFEFIKGIQLCNWIKKKVEEHDGKISLQALDYLVRNAGYDMWFLNSLVDQLLAYNSQNIQVEDVDLFLEEKLDDNIFNMIEAVVVGNKRQAFKLLEDQRHKGEDETKIFGLLVWQFRILLEMRDLYERQDGLSSDKIAKQLGIHPFVAKKNLYLIKRFSLAKLKEIHEQLMQIDYKTKTGQADQSLLVDLFISRN